MENLKWEPFSYNEKAYADLANALSTTEGIVNAFQFIYMIKTDNVCIHNIQLDLYNCNSCGYYSENGVKYYHLKKIIMPTNLLVYIPLLQTTNVATAVPNINMNQNCIILQLPWRIRDIETNFDKAAAHIIKLKTTVSKLLTFYKIYEDKALRHNIIDSYKNAFDDYQLKLHKNIGMIESTNEIEKIMSKINGHDNIDLDKNINHHDVEGYNESKTASPSAPSN